MIDSSLTENGGEKKIAEVIQVLKSVSPSCLPPPSLISDCALSTSIPFLFQTSGTPVASHAVWVQKGAALTIQRYYRSYKQRNGSKNYLKMGINGGLPLSLTARWWTPESEIVEREDDRVISHCVPALLNYHIIAAKEAKVQEEREMQARLKRERKHANMIAKRWTMVQKHPISIPSIGTPILLLLLNFF